MNENINLCEILIGHEGETFYSPFMGNVELVNVGKEFCKFLSSTIDFIISSDGKYDPNAEFCIFPSKDQRDWNKWVEEQKPKVPKTWSEALNSNDSELLHAFVAHTRKDDSRDLNSRLDNSPISKSAIALLKIHQLIEVGYGGNVANEEWVNSDGNNLIYVPFYNLVEKEFQSFGIFGLHRKSLIAFHTYIQITEFLKYPENVQLLKDYFMI